MYTMIIGNIPVRLLLFRLPPFRLLQFRLLLFRIVSKSCLGAKDTTQRSAVAIKSAVDAWDVLQCSKAVAKCGLHQAVKVACSSV